MINMVTGVMISGIFVTPLLFICDPEAVVYSYFRSRIRSKKGKYGKFQKDLNSYFGGIDVEIWHYYAQSMNMIPMRGFSRMFPRLAMTPLPRNSG